MEAILTRDLALAKKRDALRGRPHPSLRNLGFRMTRATVRLLE